MKNGYSERTNARKPSDDCDALPEFIGASLYALACVAQLSQNTLASEVLERIRLILSCFPDSCFL
jgi:lambda repressor-like predicted transcriptional regulator